ncbi:MAG: alkaline phosphatase family protein [Frankiales bacterium]|nr:alkaline phosphatase family protein [Frankiales bacterium]
MSVDGLHQSDVDWFVATHPHSTLARLVGSGVDYTEAATPIPSDSFPGMLAQATGGDPAVTGVYYDDTFNHRLLPAGTTDCANTPGGAEVGYTEGADQDQSSIAAGQAIPGLPGSILRMTGNPRTLINPAALPVDPASCAPVYPHSYLKVNTVFEVVRSHHGRTAWSDKHPAYEILNGPSGTGVQDLFTPEINSDAPARYTDIKGNPADWTGNNFATRQYDHYKVEAVRNEIDGRDHSGRHTVGTPTLFGMNFQSVSTAEKLPASTDPATGTTYAGGYLSDGFTPGPLLSQALSWVNGQLTLLTDELAARHLTGSTAIILSAKHAQSPQNPADLTRIDDGTLIDGINAAWDAAGHSGDLVAFATDDDILQFWLTDRSKAATGFVHDWLLSHDATGTTYDAADPTAAGPGRTLHESGLRAVYAGRAAAAFYGTGQRELRHPDVVGVVQHGVVFTGGVKKIAEHGGADPEDRNVPLIVDAPGGASGVVDTRSVETTRIAPTILVLLGLDPSELGAVQIEGTQALPVL